NKTLLSFLEVSDQDFAYSAKSRTDALILEWLAIHARPRSKKQVEIWNKQMLERGPEDEAQWTYFKKTRDAIDPSRTDIVTWIDLLDLEEGRPDENGNDGPFGEGSAGRDCNLALPDQRFQPGLLVLRDQDRNFDQRRLAEEIHAADYTMRSPGCQFTRWGASRPSSTAVMLSATIRPIFTLVSVVADPMCGKSTVLGSDRKRGWTCGSC